MKSNDDKVAEPRELVGDEESIVDAWTLERQQAAKPLPLPQPNQSSEIPLPAPPQTERRAEASGDNSPPEDQ